MGALLDPRYGTFRVEYRLILADGTERQIADMARAEFDAAGRPLRVVGSLSTSQGGLARTMKLKKLRPHLRRRAAWACSSKRYR
jgi:hypothetical protein